MRSPSRNFLHPSALYAYSTGFTQARFFHTVFVLRSLLSLVADAIPRRNSSSLPHFFVSGRFAGFYFPAHRPADGAQV